MLSPKRGNGFIFFLIIFQSALTVLLGFAVIFLDRYVYVDEKILDSYLIFVQDIFYFLVPVTIYFIFTKSRPGDVIPHNRLSAKNILFILALTLFFSPIVSAISSITALFAPTDVNNDILDILSTTPFIVSVISMAIMPAIFEELVFRGILLSNYKNTGLIKAAFASALFFGLIHGNVYQMIYAIAAGVFFAVLVAYTNSIFASVLSHFLFNGVQVVMTEIALNFSEAADMINNTPTLQENLTMIVMDIFLTVITLPFLILIFRKFTEYNKHNALDYRYSIKEKPLNALSINIEDGENKITDVYFVLSVIVSLMIIAVSFLI